MIQVVASGIECQYCRKKTIYLMFKDTEAREVVTQALTSVEIKTICDDCKERYGGKEIIDE